MPRNEVRPGAVAATGPRKIVHAGSLNTSENTQSPARPQAETIRFPDHRRAAIFIVEERLGGYYVICGSRGWLFPSLSEAWAEAQRIASRLGVAVRLEALR